MSLKNTIDNQIKESMLNKSKERLVALRAIKSAILLEEKNGGSKEWRLLIICCIYQKNLNWILKKDQIFI